MILKYIDAVCATSESVSRKQIAFDVSTGLIVDVRANLVTKEKVDYFFDDDCLLFAGMGDIHIHAREDLSGKNTYKEDFLSTSKAALNGGVVHVADMPNNPIPPVDDQSYLEKTALAKKSTIPILMYAGIGPQTRPLSFPVPYKVYMGPSVGDLFFKNNKELDDVLQFYCGENVSFHCEDPEILEKHKSCSDHFHRRPVSAELMATDFALSLIEKYNLIGKLCHYSAGEGLKAIKAAQKKGIKVMTEVTPQHLYFSEEAISAMDPIEQIKFQMNPPIRSKLDAEILLLALKNGEIDYLATDHAPHSREEKARGMSGLPGLDTYASFVSWLLINQNVSPQIIAKVTAENPGLFFNQFLPEMNKRCDHFKKWGKGMGFLEAGFSASFSVLNLKRPISITEDFLKTKAAWSPFLGVNFPGSLECVFLQGNKVKNTN